MEQRKNPIDRIAGIRIKSIVDFLEENEGFIKSDVLLYNLDGGGFIAVRPSGTEPKCKFYYCICGDSKESAALKSEKIKREFQLKIV